MQLHYQGQQEKAIIFFQENYCIHVFPQSLVSVAYVLYYLFHYGPLFCT